MVKYIGERVLIKLDEEDRSNDSMLYIPLTEFAETDGGRIISKASDRKYLWKGTVESMSDKAAASLEGIQVGDKVVVSRNIGSHHNYYKDHETLSPRWEGYILVSPVHIEGKIIEE